MTTTPETKDEIRAEVRSHYGKVARAEGSCCAPGCCTPQAAAGSSADSAALRLGYTEGDLATAPAGANLGLGCGNPQAIAELRPGEIVLDLGSGAGFDCFLAARQVGQAGRVIGIDMTSDMIAAPAATPRRPRPATSSFDWARSSTCRSPTSPSTW